MNKIKHILSFLTLLLPLLISAQGWEKTYDGGLDEEVYAADKTLDGGVIMAGTQSDDANNMEYSFLYKTDIDGILQWEFYDSIHIGSFVNTLDVLSTSDGNFLLSSIYGNNPPNNNYVIQKIAPGGNIIWENSLTNTVLEYVNHIVETPDGGYLLAGNYSTSDITLNAALVKLDTDGNLLWEKTFGIIDLPSYLGDVLITSSEEILMVGYLGFFNDSQDAFVKKLDNNGNIIWEQEYDITVNDYALEVIELNDGDFVIGGSAAVDFTATTASLMKISANGGGLSWYNTYPSLGDQVFGGLKATDDGGFVIAGFNNDVNNLYHDYYLLKTDSDGNEMWSKSYGRSRNDNLFELLSASDGGFYLAGSTQKTDDTNDAYLVKTDSLGNSLTNELSGNLFNDENFDCLIDANEDGMGQWLITAENAEAQYLTITDSLGNYSFTLDSGSYQITTTLISPYWSLCDTTFNIDFAGFFQTAIKDIPAQVEISCPLLDVSVGTPFVRRCFENRYTVQYCNYGTTIAEDASIIVTVDPFMVATFTSLPIESITEGVNYTFLLGDVGVGECNTITLDLLLATPLMPCDSIPLGATHCVEAHIFPDSICMPSGNWSGASVEVDAICTGDSIIFLIENVGNSATQPNLGYLVVEDDVVLLDGGFSLEPNEIESISVATNGSTFRLEAEQEPNHPGMSMPSVSVENCGDPNNTFTFNFINIFAQDDGDPFVDIDCQSNIGAYDPNDKRGFPLGYSDQNYINRGQDIEYFIRFQNTGTDTAFNIVIRDELSPLLDITSVRPGASSHPYEFNISGDGLLSFTFNNIMLPDSNINEVASHGFVKFKVSQQPNLDLETKIYNSAAIYFDFNAPSITNETLHTIGEDLMSVSIDPLETPLAQVKIYPNPFSDFTTIEVNQLEVQNGVFKVFDSTGRLIQRQSFNTDRFTFYKKNLRTGIYFFTIENEGQLISSGKLITQ